MPRTVDGKKGVPPLVVGGKPCPLIFALTVGCGFAAATDGTFACASVLHCPHTAVNMCIEMLSLKFVLMHLRFCVPTIGM